MTDLTFIIPCRLIGSETNVKTQDINLRHTPRVTCRKCSRKKEGGCMGRTLCKISVFTGCAFDYVMVTDDRTLPAMLDEKLPAAAAGARNSLVSRPV